eukprot:352387-Prorocentrum_minimum.AAC.6
MKNIWQGPSVVVCETVAHARSSRCYIFFATHPHVPGHDGAHRVAMVCRDIRARRHRKVEGWSEGVGRGHAPPHARARWRARGSHGLPGYPRRSSHTLAARRRTG